MTTDDLLKQGIAALNEGRKAEAHDLLLQVVQQDERNEMGWLWLSGAVDTDEDRRTCLENVVAINPNNSIAQRGLERFQKSSYGLDSTSDAVSHEAATVRPIGEARTGADETHETLRQAVAAIRSGEKERGKQLLVKVIEQDEGNELAWLWMARCVTDRNTKRECLERVLAINPDNKHAIEGLKRLEVLSKAEASSPERKMMTKQQTRLMLGLGGVVLTIACIGIVVVWWAVDSGLLPLGSAAPSAAESMRAAPIADATSTPVPIPTQLPTSTPLPTRVSRRAVDYTLQIEDLPSYYEIDRKGTDVVSGNWQDGYSTSFHNTTFDNIDPDALFDKISRISEDPIISVGSTVYVFETTDEAKGQAAKMVSNVNNLDDESIPGDQTSARQLSVSNFADEVSAYRVVVDIPPPEETAAGSELITYIYGFRRDNVVVVLNVIGLNRLYTGPYWNNVEFGPYVGDVEEECSFFASTILTKIDRDTR